MKNILIFYLCMVCYISYAEKCINCGFDNTSDDRYCIECGTEIRKISDKEKEKYEKINDKRIVESTNKSNISNNNKKNQFISLTYNTEVAQVFLTNLHVIVTVYNNSDFPINFLSVKVEAKYDTWVGTTIENLIQSYEGSLLPGNSVSKKINIFGQGFCLGTQIKDKIEIKVTTQNWN